MNQQRVRRGVPSGGEFATTVHDEPDDVLAQNTRKSTTYIRYPESPFRVGLGGSRAPLPGPQEFIHLRADASLGVKLGMLSLAQRRGGKSHDYSAVALRPELHPFTDAAFAWADSQSAEPTSRLSLTSPEERWELVNLMRDIQDKVDPAPVPAAPPTACSHGIPYSRDCADCAEFGR